MEFNFVFFCPNCHSLGKKIAPRCRSSGGGLIGIFGKLKHDRRVVRATVEFADGLLKVGLTNGEADDLAMNVVLNPVLALEFQAMMLARPRRMLDF